jgi:hypothetical protein
VVKNPVLQSHLFSRHFKNDCEEGIKQVLERTGGVCPLCPRFKWSNTETLGWNIFIHFARKHKITDDLEFCNNLPNQGSISIGKGFFLFPPPVSSFCFPKAKY